MLNEKKSICCHKCGHRHPMGTKCPSPRRTGKNSCARKSLKEAELTKHYKERKAERGTIVDIAARGYNIDDAVKKTLIPKLQAKLDERLTYVENTAIGMSNNFNLGLVVFMPILQTPKGAVPIEMTCGNGETGRYYVVVVANDALLTMYPTSKKEQDLLDAVQQHVKRDRPDDARPGKVSQLSGFQYKMDLEGNEAKDVEKKPEIQKTEAGKLEYEPAADYRKGNTFSYTDKETGKQYTGKIVTTSAGTGGKGDGNGKVEWVEVQLDKPFVKGGELIKTKRFYNILTDKSPLLKKGISELHTMKHNAHDEHQDPKADVEETAEYCPQCLAEYLTENWNTLEEAEYKGRKVQLGKPFLTPGGPKKRSVYVKNAKGNVIKVNFGDPNLKIKKNIPARRKAFRARHKCATAKDRTTPRYWSCKHW